MDELIAIYQAKLEKTMAARKAQKKKENTDAQMKGGAGASQPLKDKVGDGSSQDSKRKSPAEKSSAQEVANALVSLSAAAKDVGSVPSAKTCMGLGVRKESTIAGALAVPKNKRSRNNVSTPKEQPPEKRPRTKSIASIGNSIENGLVLPRPMYGGEVPRVETIASTGNSSENGLVLPRPRYGGEVPRKKDAPRPDPTSDSLLMNPHYGVKFSRSCVPFQDRQYLMETPFLQNFEDLQADVSRVLCRTQAFGDQAILYVEDLKGKLRKMELELKNVKGERDSAIAAKVAADVAKNKAVASVEFLKEQHAKEMKATKDLEKLKINEEKVLRAEARAWAAEVKIKGLEGELERLRAETNDRLSAASEAKEKEIKDAVEKALKDALDDLVSKARIHVGDAELKVKGPEGDWETSRAETTHQLSATAEAKEKEIIDEAEKALKDACDDLILKWHKYGMAYRISALYMIEVRHPDWDLSDINFDLLEGLKREEEEVVNEANHSDARVGVSEVNLKGRLAELVRLRAENHFQLCAVADAKQKEVKKALEKALKEAHDEIDSEGRKYGILYRKSALYMIKARHPDWDLSDIDFDLLEAYEVAIKALIKNKEGEEANHNEAAEENLATIKVENAEVVEEMYHVFTKMLQRYKKRMVLMHFFGPTTTPTNLD